MMAVNGYQTLDLLLATKGRLIVLTDDILDSGDNDHRKAMQTIQNRFRFGKYKTLRLKGVGIFNGRRAEQNPDFIMKMRMSDYSRDRLKAWTISKERSKNKSTEVTEQERVGLRSGVMSAMWVACECRPGVLGAVSRLARRIADATVEDLVEYNRIVKHLVQTKESGLVYRSIHPKESALAIFADGSQPPKGKSTCHGGLLICIAHPSVWRDLLTNVNVVALRAGKIDRVCTSSLAGGAYSLSGAMACVEWVHEVYGFPANSWHSNLWAKAMVKQWDQSTIVRPCRLKMNGSLYIRDDVDKRLRDHLAITDAHSLFDALEEEARGKEPRVGLAVGEIKHAMAGLAIRQRWIPHNEQVCDALTSRWARATRICCSVA